MAEFYQSDIKCGGTGVGIRVAEGVWSSLPTIKHSLHVYQIWVEAFSSARRGTAGRWMMRSAHNCELIQSSVADTRSWLVEQGKRETNVSRLFIIFAFFFFCLLIFTRHWGMLIQPWTSFPAHTCLHTHMTMLLLLIFTTREVFWEEICISLTLLRLCRIAAKQNAPTFLSLASKSIQFRDAGLVICLLLSAFVGQS